jgi:hypothetical protein
LDSNNEHRSYVPVQNHAAPVTDKISVLGFEEENVSEIMDRWADVGWKEEDCTDGWKQGEWVDGSMYRSKVSGLLAGWVDDWTDGRTDGWMDGMDGLMHGWMDGWMAGWSNGR